MGPKGRDPVIEAASQNYLYVHDLRPLIEPGNSRQREISRMRHHFPGVFPEVVSRYFDPFLGVGGMYFNMSCRRKFANDSSVDLISFYEMARDRNKAFTGYLADMAEMWGFLGDLGSGALDFYTSGDDRSLLDGIADARKYLVEVAFTRRMSDRLVDTLRATTAAWIKRFRSLERATPHLVDDQMRMLFLDCAHKAGLYEHVRAIYNDHILQHAELSTTSTLQVACWYFLRRYCGGAPRFDCIGKFTSPFSGADVCGVAPDIEVDYWYNADITAHLNETQFENADPLVFLRDNAPDNSDFVFVDLPPRSCRAFDISAHEKLAEWLTRDCRSQWMLMMRPDMRVEKFYRRRPQRSHIMYFGAGCMERHYHRLESVEVLLIKNY